MQINVNHYPCYIDGQWVNSSNSATLDVLNPSNEEVWATVPDCTEEDVNRALLSSKNAQLSWQMLPAIERAKYIMKIVEGLKPKREHFARLLVLEQGKTLPEAFAEFDDTLNYLTYSAEAARRIQGEIFPSENTDEQLMITKVPYGVCLGLCAYNYPLALIGRKVGPALVTGNTMVLKAHEATPVTASEFCKVVDEVGVPPGVINLVSGAGISVSSQLVSHPLTRLISLTGSTRAGQAIYKAASDNVAGLVLELGGKAAFIVLKDADIDKAAEAAVVSRYANCGQVCICNELVLVHEDVAEEFTKKVLEKVREITFGDPMSGVNMGPSVTSQGIDRVETMVNLSVDMGASVAIGGKRPQGAGFEKGYWFEPTVLTGVTREMPVAKEEMFAPVMPIIRVKDYEEALDITNDREDGLSSYLYTQHIPTIMDALKRMEVGTVFVNTQIVGYVQGYHSGHKRSGTGGEDGIHGIENYLQKRTVYWNYA
ncbi:aldehyde dehydrogenase family protein [Vibrio ulleungensis]|uniref:Aldehyde dehydrogenase family protein n=1 Tax=Vibrio ulleungensis TaxID=2807619 RepID=A0ABS2HJU9_9VIBR|nr:aldehyde dehydrogenase family protein [Vibrio ulleungensis]MBM7036106.1 aldehyde dehydrogenase family protein [Vibrio ulleungensis]